MHDENLTDDDSGEQSFAPGSPEASAPKVDPNAPLPERVVATLKTIYDPEIPVDIYELGLIYRSDVDEAGVVDLVMTLTSPTCPVAGSLPGEVEQKVRRVEGVSDVKFELTWDPPWDPEKMSEAAKLTLGMI